MLLWKVTEHYGQCEHRPFWRNVDGTETWRISRTCTCSHFFFLHFAGVRVSNLPSREKRTPPQKKKHFGSFRVFLVIVERVWLDSALCSSPWTSCGIARKTCSELPISFNAPISCRAPSDVCVFFKFLRRPRVFAKQQSMIPRKMRNDRRQNRSSDRVLSSVRSNNVPSS